MADIFSKEKRSEVMSRIRPKGTKPEELVFKFLRKEKIHFQKHYRKAPGSPDVALPSKKLAVLIDGDFWHGKNFNTWKQKLPKVYWQDKIAANVKRDRRNRAAMKKLGWKVLRVWESDLAAKRREKTLAKVAAFLREGSL